MKKRDEAEIVRLRQVVQKADHLLMRMKTERSRLIEVAEMAKADAAKNSQLIASLRSALKSSHDRATKDAELARAKREEDQSRLSSERIRADAVRVSLETKNTKLQADCQDLRQAVEDLKRRESTLQVSLENEKESCMSIREELAIYKDKCSELLTNRDMQELQLQELQSSRRDAERSARETKVKMDAQD